MMRVYKQLHTIAKSNEDEVGQPHYGWNITDVRCFLIRNDLTHVSRKGIAISILLFLLVGCATLLVVREFLYSDPPDDSFETVLADMDELSKDYPIYIDSFVKFTQEYDRRYSSNDEMRFRFRNFVRNMKFIKRAQKGRDNVVFGITRFTDWSEAEMRSMTCEDWPANEVGSDITHDERDWSSEISDRPDAFDWRTKSIVTDIKDQGRCASCWAFGAVGVVESMNAIAKNPLVSLSEQELIDCDTNDNGCSGGYRPYAFRYVRRHGIVSEKDYPYKGQEQPECAANGTRVYIKSIKYIRRNEDAMADFVYYRGPISVGINVTKELFHYRSGVFTPNKDDCKEDSQGSHAMAVVGYGTQNGEDYWLIKNSWGKKWGMDGYLLYKRGENGCGIANAPFSVEA